MIVSGTVFGAFVLILLGVNLYLQSETVQERLRQAAASTLGLPIHIKGASYTPWTGLTLSGLSAEDSERVGQNVFEASRLNVRLAIFPLLAKKVIITSISLQDPVVVFSERNQVVPLPPTRAEVVVENVPEPVPAVTESLPDAESVADPERKPDRVSIVEPMRFTIEIQDLRVQNGMILVKGKNGSTVALLTGVEIHSKVPSDFEAKGEIRILEAAFGGRMFVRNFQSPFQREDGRFSLQGYSAQIGQGTWQGNLSVEEKTGAYEVDGLLSDIGIPALLIEAQLPHDRAEGTLSGDFRLSGGGDLEHPRGRADLLLSDAVLEPLDFIQQLGQLLRVDELQLLRLSDARMALTVAEGIIHVDQIRLQSENLILGAEGPVEMSGEMELAAKLMVNQRLQQNLGGLIGKNFEPSDEEGYKELPFRIFGPVQKPRTDLLDRLTGVQIGGEVGRFLQNLFGAPPKKKSKGD